MMREDNISGIAPAKLRGWRAYGLLVLLCAVLYVPGLASLPVMDRDEARFAQATRQMLETGDFLRIRFLDEARNNKPAGIYWLQAASVAALSNAESSAIWPYRLPSLLGATGAVLLTFAFGARLIGAAPALAGAALLASSLGLGIEAHLAKTDAVLLCLTVAAQGALALIWRGEGGWRWALLFWLAQAAAILVKGPVTPALSLLTALALTLAMRDWRWLKRLRPFWGLPLVVLIVAPWLAAINLATHGAFLGQSVGQDFLGKIAGGENGHGAIPGYYLALVWATFWPGSLLLLPAAWLAWRERREPATLFLIAWAVPFWIALELVPTKLPNYLLPVFPALALLAGRALYEGRALPRVAWRLGACLWAATTLAIAVALAVAPIALRQALDFAGLVVALVAILYAARAVPLLWRGPDRSLALRAALLAVVVLPAGFAIVVPRLDPLWLSRGAARLIASRAPPGTAVTAVGYAEPSLAFLLGTGTRFARPIVAAQSVADSPRAMALVEAREDREFRADLAARGFRAEPLGEVAGLDYSNGRRMVLTLYRAAPS
jgi:4-amino-4-deoxy-L-arabinose transferase-like glycosyltransferase